MPRETREARLGDPWKTRVHDLSDKNEETQSTIQVGVWVAISRALSVEVFTCQKQP